MAFERGWASIPAELKVHTLSYALQSDGPVDCKMAEDMIKQSYPLFSEKFIDSVIAIEIFYGANTFQLRGTVIDGKPNFMLPPPHYRKYIHHVELHLIPNVELYTQVTSINLKALFPLINSLKITVECDFSNTSMVSFLNTKVTELPPFNLDSLEIVFIPLLLRGIAATGWVYIHPSISIRCRTIRLLRLSGEILYTGMKCETVSGVHVERSWWVKKKLNTCTALRYL